jgi:hypothetical protein
MQDDQTEIIVSFTVVTSELIVTGFCITCLSSNEQYNQNSMELLELIGWMALGFVPTYAALEVGTRKLARRMSAKLSMYRDSQSKVKTEMMPGGL